MDEQTKLMSCVMENGDDKYSASRVLAVAATVEMLLLVPAVFITLLWGPLTGPLLETFGGWVIKFYATAIVPFVVNYFKRAFND